MGASKPKQHYKHIRRPGHPLARTNGDLPEHRFVLWAKIGPGEHRCNWCEATVRWKTGSDTTTLGNHADGVRVLVCDHVDGNWKNNNPSNLVPSCQPCNCSRGREPKEWEPHIKVMTSLGVKRRRAVPRICEREECSKPFVAFAGNITYGKARFCSKGCASAFRFAKNRMARMVECLIGAA
jgi:hypothetical protein